MSWAGNKLSVRINSHKVSSDILTGELRLGTVQHSWHCDQAEKVTNVIVSKQWGDKTSGLETGLLTCKLLHSLFTARQALQFCNFFIYPSLCAMYCICWCAVFRVWLALLILGEIYDTGSWVCSLTMAGMGRVKSSMMIKYSWTETDLIYWENEMQSFLTCRVQVRAWEPPYNQHLDLHNQ